MCPAGSVLERDAESLRLKWKSEGDGGREMVTPTDEKSSPKQPQISFALLRRQGAEHKVLVDITKPLKTTLQPWMYSPHRIYPVTDAHCLHSN